MKFTDNLESAELFRRWTAITTIAAALEQKVWITTSDNLYANLYTILVGHPGVGKTRTIMSGRKLLAELSDFHIAPTSVRMASLVDSLSAAKRTVFQNGVLMEEFNSMTLLVDEWTAFMHAYDDELVGGLTTFYDVVVPYEQHRRGKDIRISIKRPQLSILAGSTPSNLIKFIPDFAWDQGFTSRVILVYSNDRFVGDDFAANNRPLPPDLVHDLKLINALQGQFAVDPEYARLVKQWRDGGELPKPTQPKLAHYNTRRRAHLYKLSMVASVDRGDSLRITSDDYYTAMGWLCGAERDMPKVFAEGTASIDSRACDEIVDWVRSQPDGVPDWKLRHEVGKRVALYAVQAAISHMESSNQLARNGNLWGAVVR